MNSRGELVQLPTGRRFMSGPVGMTRRQAAHGAALSAFETMAREVARREFGGAGV